MSDDIFHAMIGRVLGSEGGYVNNPLDPGGETKWGIAKRTYPNVDIASLSRDDAIAIYYRDFWLRIGGAVFAPGCTFQILDAAINHGIGNALRMAQRAAGVADDGSIGPVSVAAINRLTISDFILLFNAERVEFFTKLVAFTTFGRGWTNRVAANLRYGASDN